MKVDGWVHVSLEKHGKSSQNSTIIVPMSGHVNDGFPRKVCMVGGWDDVYPGFFWGDFGNFSNFAKPLCQLIFQI